MKRETGKRIVPFVLSALILVADQVTKALIAATVVPYSIAFSIGGDFLRVIHARNTGIAFSIGNSLPETARMILFTAIPILVVAAVVVYAIVSGDLTPLQRWLLAGIVGGGLGNAVDRLFRPDGVVDFIDVKFFGLFGLERWPTFNVADASVFVCGIILVLSVFIPSKSGVRT